MSLRSSKMPGHQISFDQHKLVNPVQALFAGNTSHVSLLRAQAVQPLQRRRNATTLSNATMRF
jgi:hypothetical protein